MGLYANLRPVRPVPALYDASPLKREVIEGTDLLVVRELTGGIYFGEKTRTEDSASDLCAYTVTEIDRIARTAFGAARRKVTSVDKANVLETSRLWRATVVDVAADFDVPLEHVLVDNAAMQLVSNPSDFDVIVTENMFGDILSDEAAMITGSIGMLPSASLGGARHPRDVRARARFGAGHRGPGDRQPAGDVPLGRDVAAPWPRFGFRGGRPRIGRGLGSARRAAHPRSGRRRHHRAGHPGSPRPPAPRELT